MADSTASLGQALWKQGQLVMAKREVKRALLLYRTVGFRSGVARCQVSLATIARQRGRVGRAVRRARLALAVAEPNGFRDPAAKAWNLLGEVARKRGDLPAAEAAYARSAGLYRAMGSRFGLAPALNRGVVLVDVGRFDEARAQLEHELGRARRLGMAGSTLGALISLLPCDAHDGDWLSWDIRLAEARGLLARTGYVEEDCPILLTRAGQLAMDAGERDRGIDALALAADRWRALGRTDAADRVEGLLDSMVS